MIAFLKLGGPVMWVTLLFGFVVVVLIVQRALHVHRASLRGRDFLTGIFNNLQRGNVMEAVALCEDAPGPVPQMTRAAILEHQRGGQRTGPAMQEVGFLEIARLEQYLPILLALAQLGPMLGLLGTVVGMWDMLVALHLHAPLLHAGDLGGGLGRALSTTMVGLSVGLVGFFGHAFIVSRIGDVVLEMERAYNEILQALGQLPMGEGKG